MEKRNWNVHLCSHRWESFWIFKREFKVAFKLSPTYHLIALFRQIHALGDTSSCGRNDCHHLDYRRFRLLRTHITRSPSAKWAINYWNTRRKGISNVRARFNTNICCGFKLYQLLSSMYCSRRHLLQVNKSLESLFDVERWKEYYSMLWNNGTDEISFYYVYISKSIRLNSPPISTSKRRTTWMLKIEFSMNSINFIIHLNLTRWK